MIIESDLSYTFRKANAILVPSPCRVSFCVPVIMINHSAILSSTLCCNDSENCTTSVTRFMSELSLSHIGCKFGMSSFDVSISSSMLKSENQISSKQFDFFYNVRFRSLSKCITYDMFRRINL